MIVSCKSMRIYLIVCCLLLGQINTNVAKNLATTDRPLLLLDGNHQLLNIQTKLLKIQDDIISITAAIGITETLDNLTDKIVAIEEDFQHVKEQLANERRKPEAGEYSKDVKTIINNHYNAVSAELKNLQSSLRAYRELRLPSETIADIKALRFELAEQKLKQMNNFEDISKILQTVYTDFPDSFEVLANFIESLSDIKLIEFSVRVLRKQMAGYDPTYPFKWIRLVKILETKVLNQPKIENSLKELAKFTDNGLKDSIRFFAIDALNASVSNGKFERNTEIDNLTTAIYQFNPLQSENIIEEFVNTNYGQLSSKKILETIISHRFIQQRARGLSVLFWKVKKAQNLNSDATIKIALALYQLHSDNDYGNLNKTQKIEVDKIIDNIPACARNLFFLRSVCFWNKEKEEYLTAGAPSTLYDNSRRNIFSTDPLPESQWYVNITGDNFLFSSRSYDNEYLYAAAFKFNDDLRYVFNWIPGNNTDKQSEWSVELDDDYCYVKSAMYNEYLFSSNHKRPDGSSLRSVFTWVPGHSVRESKFQWQIRKCD